jgi:3-hydroxymyristoyl/3-hydroxydecanoyl-(acyl carrier protein) dehydratase
MTTMPGRITLILVANVIDLDTNNKVVTNTFIDTENVFKNHFKNKKEKTCNRYLNTHDHGKTK